MEGPRKKAKTRPDDGSDDDGTAPSAAGRQIAELQAELERCKREKNALSDALRWACSVEVTPREHWLRQGRTLHYAVAMDFLRKHFKEVIEKLRTGTILGDDVRIMFCLQDEEGHSVTAQHDDVTMPYWTELANAIGHWSEYHADEEATLSMVAFAHVETPAVVLDILRPVIKKLNVKGLGFVDNCTPRTWNLAEFFEDVVQTNHKVTRVGFGSIMLSSNEEWKAISNTMRIRSTGQSAMESVSLKKCFVDGIHAEVLKNILTSNAEDIYLDGNGLSSQEAPIIAEFLNSNRALARLHLKDNRFNDADAEVLADSLSSNTNLRVLDVSGNTEMRVNGRLAFLRATFDVSSLASCAASNHTCQVWGLEQDISALNGYLRSSFNKWEKIFAMLALSSEESFINTALLNEVPASLMPVLFVQANDQDADEDAASNSKITDLYLEVTNTKRCRKHDAWDNLDEKRPLNCVYELFRSWVVPSIFV